MPGSGFGAPGFVRLAYACSMAQIQDGVGRLAKALGTLLHLHRGTPYVYQGEELGLEEVEDLPEEALEDPTWVRSGRTIRGRDGCRVPLPRSGSEPPFGFGPDGRHPWLPQPAHWRSLTAEALGRGGRRHLRPRGGPAPPRRGRGESSPWRTPG